jgi:hypothetical protein
MMALAQHLRADHQYWVSNRQLLNQVRHRLAAGHGVAVDANHRELSKALGEKRLGLLGANAGTDQSMTLALGALAGQR